MNWSMDNVYLTVLNCMNENQMINFQIKKLDEILDLDTWQIIAIGILMLEQIQKIKTRQTGNQQNSNINNPKENTIENQNNFNQIILTLLNDKQKLVYENIYGTKQFTELFSA